MKHRYGRTALAVGLAAAIAVAVQQLPSAVAADIVQPASVTLAGSLDSEIGCASDWQPDCAAAHLTLRPDGIWSATFTLPASPPGGFDYKVALNDNFTVSYGAGGGSGNINLTVPAGGGEVTFYFDPASHWATDTVNSSIATAVGDFQTTLGCAANNTPDCLKTWLEDLDGDGTYTLVTGALAAGTYSVQAAVAGSLTGAAQSFTVPPGGGRATTTISYVGATGALAVSVVPLVQGPPATYGSPTAKRGDVVVNLFEWNWKSIASECTTVLGPAGGATCTAP